MTARIISGKVYYGNSYTTEGTTPMTTTLQQAARDVEYHTQLIRPDAVVSPVIVRHILALTEPTGLPELQAMEESLTYTAAYGIVQARQEGPLQPDEFTEMVLVFSRTVRMRTFTVQQHSMLCNLLAATMDTTTHDRDAYLGLAVFATAWLQHVMATINEEWN